MILYPKGYFNKVSEISLDYLKENNIKGLILDVDNTLIDYYRNMSKETMDWADQLIKNGIEMCILSNSNKKDKIEEVANKLGISKYSYFAKKPLKIGFKKAKEMLGLDVNQIAVVGDQIFTDVLGANRMKMHSILVDPINEKDMIVTLIKRPIENAIKAKYLEKTKLSSTTNKPKYQTQTVDINHKIAQTAMEKQKKKSGDREEK